jgi:hypothetical protein
MTLKKEKPAKKAGFLINSLILCYRLITKRFVISFPLPFNFTRYTP